MRAHVPNHLGADVLEVNMGNAPGPLVHHPHHVPAAKEHVPGIEAELHLGARPFHQPVHVLLGLDDRAHVVVIGKGHPLPRHPFGHFRQLRRIGQHLVAGELRARIHRHALHPLHGVGAFRVNDARRAKRDELLDLRADRGTFLGHAPHQRIARAPAAAERDVIGL